MMSLMLRSIRDVFYRLNIPLSDSDPYILSLKNCAVGKTCFIIGSGPSLAMPDLDLIKGYDSFGVNKIYLAFEHTKWRPSFYVVADRRIAQEVSQEVAAITCPRFVEQWAAGPVQDSGDWTVLREIYSGRARSAEFSTNILRGVGGGATVIYTCLQIAFYMGYSTVGLLGVDFGYGRLTPTGAVTASGEVLVTASSSSYFTEKYAREGRIMSAPRYDEQRAAFRNAYDVFSSAGRTLLNASRRTELDVIPRCALEDIVSGYVP